MGPKNGYCDGQSVGGVVETEKTRRIHFLVGWSTPFPLYNFSNDKFINKILIRLLIFSNDHFTTIPTTPNSDLRRWGLHAAFRWHIFPGVGMSDCPLPRVRWPESERPRGRNWTWQSGDGGASVRPNGHATHTKEPSSHLPPFQLSVCPCVAFTKERLLVQIFVILF